MSDALQTVRDEIEGGAVSAQTLVSLYRAAEEAADDGDLHLLAAVCELARRACVHAAGALEDEAKRLAALCEERLETLQGELGTAICPGCGRTVPASAVRCRACGELLV